jgi:hypothetical protein
LAILWCVGMAVDMPFTDEFTLTHRLLQWITTCRL